VSDFISEEDGCLVVQDADGTIIEDAQVIIHPGSKGGPWWDCDQMITQVKGSIGIHERSRPGTQALFVFDQSSAHASLPDGALRAFDMNRRDGRKQRIQKDTVIPESNPVASLRGKPQKMTLDDGSPKGLERVLAEQGFNTSRFKHAKCKPVCPVDSVHPCCMTWVLSQQDDFAHQVSMLEQIITEAGHLCIFLPKFHCELNPIEMVCTSCIWKCLLTTVQFWGWVKYQYRQEEKATFAAAKEAAVKWLDACPTEIIRRFVNRSWRFMDAY
jgi:hypothetical protein